MHLQQIGIHQSYFLLFILPVASQLPQFLFLFFYFHGFYHIYHSSYFFLFIFSGGIAVTTVSISFFLFLSLASQLLQFLFFPFYFYGLHHSYHSSYFFLAHVYSNWLELLQGFLFLFVHILQTLSSQHCFHSLNCKQSHLFIFTTHINFVEASLIYATSSEFDLCKINENNFICSSIQTPNAHLILLILCSYIQFHSMKEHSSFILSVSCINGSHSWTLIIQGRHLSHIIIVR